MSAPAAIKSWLAGSDPLVPTAGDGGTWPLKPIGEGAAAGTIPIGPDLVRAVSLSRATRTVRARSGELCAAPLATARRGTFDLQWSGRSKADRDTITAYLRDTCRGGGVPFAVHIDGGSDGTDLVNVRQIGPVSDVMTDNGAAPVYTIRVSVEETF